MNFSLCLDGLCLLLLASVGISSPVAAAASSSLDTAAVGHTVWTTSGKLIGHPSVKKPAVLEFLGIPYAQPPVGDLRFAPPQSYSSRETFTASDYVCYPKEYLREIAVVWDADVWCHFCATFSRRKLMSPTLRAPVSYVLTSNFSVTVLTTLPTRSLTSPWGRIS